MQILYTTIKRWGDPDELPEFYYKEVEGSTLEEAKEYLIQEGITKLWHPTLLVLDQIYRIDKITTIDIRETNIHIRLNPLQKI